MCLDLGIEDFISFCFCFGLVFFAWKDVWLLVIFKVCSFYFGEILGFFLMCKV